MFRQVTVLSALCIIISLSRPQDSSDRIKPCLTPNSTQGYCINLQMCSSIYEISNDYKRPITIETLQFLIKSQCGFNNTTPKVCCPVTDPSLSFLENTVEAHLISDDTKPILDEKIVENADNLMPCLTPNSTAGRCVLFEACPMLYQMSDSIMNLTDYSKPDVTEKFLYLKDSLCGFDITKPKVCCPLSN